jgi:DNA-directed RNA polymerase specialized sigma24 family protein
MNTVAQLEQEWEVLTRRELARALPAWAIREPSLRRFDSPSTLLRFLHTSESCETDVPLRALLAIARTDRLAGRFLLQALLPGLKTQLRRIAHSHARYDELWELLLFYAWEAICGYPLETRPTRVAANLLLQVLHDASREFHRARRQPHLQPARAAVPTRRPLPARCAPRPLLRASTLRTALGAGAVSRRDASLILRSRVRGVSLQLLAEEANVPYQTLLKRRQRAEHALRHWLRMQGNVRNRRPRVLTSTGPSRRRRACRPHSHPQHRAAGQARRPGSLVQPKEDF